MEIRYYLTQNFNDFDNDKAFSISLDASYKNRLFTKELILNLLSNDGLNRETIDIIKYYDSKSRSFKLLPNTERINFNSQDFTLLIRLSSDNNSNSSYQYKRSNSINNQLNIRLKRLEEEVYYLKEKIETAENVMAVLETPDLIENIYFNNKPRLDIVYLYSNPLVRFQKNKCISMNEPVDFESEISSLVESFKSTKKKISASFEVAKIESFSSVIRRNPKILHISCHGSYEETVENQFYLHFEDDFGRLLKFDLDNLKELLQVPTDTESQIEVVFVSACHSDAISNVFVQANVPVVISVHSSAQILDEAARKFSKIFYNSLLDGKSIKYSFEQAKGVVSVSIDKNYSNFHCCCSHSHKSTCKWRLKLVKDKDTYEAHRMHLKNCTCAYKEFHIHIKQCSWVNNFIKSFDFQQSQSVIYIDDKLIKICCCYPEIAHDESKKFILKMHPDYNSKILFSNLQDGVLEIRNKNCFLNMNLGIDIKSNLIGRNKDLYEIICFLNDDNHAKNRVVTIIGEDGLGKNSLCKSTARYIFERKIFADGVVYINTNMTGKIFSEMWFMGRILQGLELDTQINDAKDFCKLLGNLKILIIVNFTIIQEEVVIEFNKLITEILENTNGIKFIISISDKVKWSYSSIKGKDSEGLSLDLFTYNEKKIYLSPLNPEYSVKLLRSLISNLMIDKNSPLYYTDELKNLTCEHEIIKISKGLPGKIYKIAGLLQEKKRYDDVITLLRREDSKMENLSNELIKLLFENLNISGESLVSLHDVLFLLSILPNGILEYEITEMFENESVTLIGVLDNICNSTMIISFIRSVELKSRIFMLSKDLYKSVLMSSLIISEESQIKIYRNLIIFYANLCQNIMKNINYYIKWESPEEFSAAQNFGLWVSFNSEISRNYNNSLFGSKFVQGLPPVSSVYEPIKRFNFDEINIMNVIRVENKYLKILIMNNDLEFIESIERLSILIPTISKMNKKITDCFSYYTHFLAVCKTYPNVLSLSHARLLLFSAALTGLNLSNNLEESERIFRNNNYEEGIGELYYAKALIKWEADWKKYISGYPSLIPNGECVNNLELKKQISFQLVFEKEIFKDFSKSLKIFSKLELGVHKAKVLYSLAICQMKSKIFDYKTFESLQEASKIFDENNLIFLKIKSILAIAQYYLELKNYEMCRKVSEETEICFKFLQKNKFFNKKTVLINDIKENIAELLEKCEIGTLNYCIFLASFFLTKSYSNNEVDSGNTYFIGDSSSICSNFPEKIREKLDESNMSNKLLLKFDYLTEESFKHYLKKNGKIMCIFSQDCDSEYISKDSIIAENLIGESFEIYKEDIEKILTNIDKIRYDLIILALPQSNSLAQCFIDAGVPYVISFNISPELKNTSNKAKYFPNPKKSVEKVIEQFVIDFVYKMFNIKDKDLFEIFENSRKLFLEKLIKLYNLISDLNFETIKNEKLSKLGDVFINSNLNMVAPIELDLKILNKDNKESVLKIQHKFKKERIINLPKSNYAFIGRKKELYNGIKICLEYDYLNVYGEKNVGCTSFTTELAYYLYYRNHFAGGVFYFDLEKIEKWVTIKEKFSNNELYSTIEECKKGNFENKILIILDNIENVAEDNNMFLQLSSLRSESNKKYIVIILISKEKLINKNNENIEYIHITRLSNTCSAILLLSNCKRSITSKEIDIDKNDNVNIGNMLELVMCSKRLKLCQGYPKLIKKLSAKVSLQTLCSIDYIDYLPKKFVNRMSTNSRMNNNISNTISFSNSFSKKNQVQKCENSSLTEEKINLNKEILIDKYKSFKDDSYCLDNLQVNNKSQIDVNKKLNGVNENFQKKQNINKLDNIDMNISIDDQRQKFVNSQIPSIRNYSIINCKRSLKRFEVDNKIHNLDSKYDSKLISLSFIKFTDNQNIIPVSTYKYDVSTDKWKSLTPKSIFMDQDMLSNNHISVLSKKICSKGKLISLENSIVSMIPDLINIQNIKTLFLDEIAGMKFIRDNYLISFNYNNTDDTEEETFSVVIHKFMTQFYTFNQPLISQKFLFCLTDVVLPEDVNTLLLASMDFPKSSDSNFNISKEMKNLNIISKFLNSIRLNNLILIGEFFSDKEEKLVMNNLPSFIDCWKIFIDNNNLKETDGITHLKNYTRVDKILLKSKNDSMIVNYMENFVSIDNEERAALYASFAFK